jgi:sporulation protein YlmC with PRC-barrel domain
MQKDAERPSINVDAKVVGSDGTELGKVGCVVVRPPQFEITDIVVTTGSLLGRDIVVPIDHVTGSNEDHVQLDLLKKQLDGLEDYVEAHYDRPPDDWYATSGMYYAGTPALWPAGSYVGSYIPVPSSVEVNAPAGTVGLHEGMEVESSDGHKVGTIHSIQTDSTSEDVTALVVKHGMFFSSDTVIPVTEIADTRDARVVLRLSRDEVKERFEES